MWNWHGPNIKYCIFGSFLACQWVDLELVQSFKPPLWNRKTEKICCQATEDNSRGPVFMLLRSGPFTVGPLCSKLTPTHSRELWIKLQDGDLWGKLMLCPIYHDPTSSCLGRAAAILDFCWNVGVCLGSIWVKVSVMSFTRFPLEHNTVQQWSFASPKVWV